VSQQDSLHRFIFEHTPIRGELVRLDATWQSVLQNHDYPPVLLKAMGELMAAAALLAATLKLQGALVLQLQGQGPVTLLVVECTGEMTMRATAKWSGELESGTLRELVGDGRFVITLDPKNGNQAYQGIVPLEGDSIADILQNYMLRSEQLETRLFLTADENQAAGMLLQKLPGQPEQDQDAWHRAGILAETVKPDELLHLSAETLLQRLFSEEDLRLFEAQPIRFHCSCSREGVSNMLRMLGREEIDSVLAEQGSVEVNCDFCNRHYAFDAVDVEQVFALEPSAPGGQTRH
jgi:molecular chaperone Hsp33